MTTKHGAGVARANLYVAKQRAAAAMTGPQKRIQDAKMRAMQEKARAARALAAAKKLEAQASDATEQAAPVATPAAAAPKKR